MIMKVEIKFYVISIVYLYVLVHGSLGNDDDLYGVLGVGRKADLKEIKRAYKTLAKEWYELISSKRLCCACIIRICLHIKFGVHVVKPCKLCYKLKK